MAQSGSRAGCSSSPNRGASFGQVSEKQAGCRYRRTCKGRGFGWNWENKDAESRGRCFPSPACWSAACADSIQRRDNSTSGDLAGNRERRERRKRTRGQRRDVPIKKAPDYSEIRAESKREEGGGRCELRPEPAEVDRFAVKGQGKKRGGVNLSQGCREAMDGRRDPRNQSEKRAGSAQLRRAGRLGQPPTLAHSGGGSTANVSQPQIGPSSPKQKY